MTQPTPDPLADILTIDEVAAILKTLRRAALNLAAEGRFPGAFKVGDGAKTSPWRIPRSGVDAYIKAQQAAVAAALAARAGQATPEPPDGRVRRSTPRSARAA